MQYELLISTYLPGQANEAAQWAAETGHIAGLHGYWLSSDIGVQNQTIELWSQHRPVPQGDPPLEQSSWTLSCAVEPKASEISGGVYELRRYRMRGGTVSSWLGIFLKALPARERYSRLAGLFISQTGEEDAAVHFWGYADLTARAAARAAALQDPDWQVFLKESRRNRYVQRQESTILLPASHSPMA